MSSRCLAARASTLPARARLWLRRGGMRLTSAGALVTWSVVRERHDLHHRGRGAALAAAHRRLHSDVEFPHAGTHPPSMLHAELSSSSKAKPLFRVAQETTRAFIVRADGTSVRAIATEFDVDERTRGTVVTVMQGRVAVSPADAPSLRSSVKRPALEMRRS